MYIIHFYLKDWNHVRSFTSQTHVSYFSFQIRRNNNSHVWWLVSKRIKNLKKQFWVMCLIEISSYNHAIDTEIVLKQNNNAVRPLHSLTVEFSCWITGLNWPRDIDFHMFAFIFFIMFLPTYINSNSFYCSFWYFHLRHYLI